MLALLPIAPAPGAPQRRCAGTDIEIGTGCDGIDGGIARTPTAIVMVAALV